MAPFRHVTILVALLLTFSVPFASATSIIPVSLTQLTERADSIVAGVITETHSYWEDGRIYTDATVETMEYLKHPTAERPHRIVVKSLGGEVEHTRMHVNGVPELVPDTEVVLFLIKRQDKYIIYGLHYGLCVVEPDYDAQSQRVSGPVFRAQTTRNLTTMALTRNPLPSSGERIDLFFERVRRLVQDTPNPKQ
ncbi:hypothetical protein DSLASN_19530 [Desulfoluna limicola]|uniref:Uncharacterized protein n=1 Tax=Desulfoluna limicola TaxID=2810562 RepID=A0ABM7PG67_9BACT|nr:hypothetical protein [Desulfoluna limicola]BCS96321.1 hypothetical protein DSLASN_19530 [Desulfoluna limicola]